MVNYSAYHWSEKARKYAETIGTIFNVKGRVNTVADLPISGNKVGDLYLVGLSTDADLTEYAWLSFDGTTRWERLGYTSITNSFSALTGSPNDNVALKNALDGKYSVSNPAGYISGITSAMVTTALGYSPVNPTSLASVATSGSYNDLSNKPIIPAAQVNSDWNANSGVAQILNKPTLATVATTGAYSDLSGKPTIPTVNNSTITFTQGGVTKGSITLNQSTDETIELDAGGGGSVNTFDLFDHKWSDYLLSDQSWLRADTFSWQDGTVYSDAYNHLVADYNGGTSTTETVGSYTITYVLAADGHKITTDEATVANIYAESGVAWYYILDTVNTRFKLPRENPAREELIQVVRAKGSGIALGLTDGSQNAGLLQNNYSFRHNVSAVAAYGASIGTTNNNEPFSASGKSIGITQDSTKSGIISSMTDSTSVYKGKQYLYFYVGQFSQSATEQTAGLNSELFNGKVDLNLNNMNPSAIAKETIVGWGMPDYSAGVSKTWNTDIVASKNCFVVYGGYSDNNTTNSMRFYIDGNIVGSFVLANAGVFMQTFFVPKGHTYKATLGTRDQYIIEYPLLGG